MKTRASRILRLSLSLCVVPVAVACGPRDPREPVSTSGDRVRCQARVRCYRAIITEQQAAVRSSRVTVANMYRVRLLDKDPTITARAAAALKATGARAGRFSKSLKPLLPPGAPATLVDCTAARLKLGRAMTLLKAEHTYLLQQVVDRLSQQLRDPDEQVRKLARVGLDDLRKAMQRTQKKLTSLPQCKPFVRQK